MEDAKFGSILNKVGSDFNGVNTYIKKMSSLKKGFDKNLGKNFVVLFLSLTMF